MPSDNPVQQFTNQSLGVAIRVIDRDGEPWFVAKDICLILDHTNPSMAIQGLDDDEKGVSKVYTLGGTQEMAVISESGLYTLLVRSNKGVAKPFRRWVTHEVLPSIRKTGGYVTPETLDKISHDPKEFIALLEAWKQEHDRRKLLEERANIFGNRTPFGEISDVTGNPKYVPVRAYLRSNGIAKIITTTEVQLRLFDFD